MNRWMKFINLLLASALVCTQAVQAQMVRGTPGVDYPNYPSIPETSFRCSDQTYNPGFYADPETECQVFHFCFNHRHESFLCPAGTIFNQAILACDSWYTSNCSMAPMFYSVNFGPVLEKAGKDIPMLLKLRDRAGMNFQSSATTEHVLDQVSSLYETSTQTLESSDIAGSDNRIGDRTVEPDIEASIQNSGNETVSTENGLEDDSNTFPQNDQNIYAKDEYKNLNEENPWGELSYPDEIQPEVFFDGTNYYNFDQPLSDYGWKDSQPSEEFRTFYEDYEDRFQRPFDGAEDGFQEANEIAESEHVTESLYEGENESRDLFIDPMQEFSKRLIENKRRRNPQYVVIEEETNVQIPVRTRVTRLEQEQSNLQDYEPLSDVDLATELPLKLESSQIDQEKTLEDPQFIEIPDEPEDISDPQAPEQADDANSDFHSILQVCYGYPEMRYPKIPYPKIPGEQSIQIPDGEDSWGNSRGEEIDLDVNNFQNEDPSAYTDEMEDGYIDGSDRFNSRPVLSEEFKRLPVWAIEQVQILAEKSAEEREQRKMDLKSKSQSDGGFVVLPDETKVQEKEDLLSGAGPEFSGTVPGDSYLDSEDEEIPENYGSSGVYERVYSDENDSDFYNPNPANYYGISNNPYPSQFEGMEYSSEFWPISVGPGHVTRFIPPYYTSRAAMSDESQLQDFQPTGAYGIVEAVTEVPAFAGMDSVETDLELQESEVADNRHSYNGYGNAYGYGYYMPDMQADDYRNYDSQWGYLNDQVYSDAFSEDTRYNYELDGSSNFVDSRDSDVPVPNEESQSVENIFETGEQDSSLTENNEAFSVQSDEHPNADGEFSYDSNDFLEVPGNLGLNYGKESDDTLYVFDFEPEETNDSQISEGESPEDRSFETLAESLEFDSNLQNEDEAVVSNVARSPFSTGAVTEAKINDTSTEGRAKETISVEFEKDKPVTLTAAAKHLSGLKPSKSLPPSENSREDFTPPSENRLLNSMFPTQMNFNPYVYGGNMGQFGMMDSSNTVPFSRSGNMQVEQSGQQGKLDKSKLSSIQEKLRSMTRGKFGVFKKLIKSNP